MRIGCFSAKARLDQKDKISKIREVRRLAVAERPSPIRFSKTDASRESENTIRFNLYRGYLILARGSARHLNNLNLPLDTGTSSTILNQRLATVDAELNHAPVHLLLDTGSSSVSGKLPYGRQTLQSVNVRFAEIRKRFLDGRGKMAAASVAEYIAFQLRATSSKARRVHHQMRHRFSFTIAWPALHANAFSNSGIFTTRPLTRYLPGECGSVMAFMRRFSGRLFSQAHCAFPTKKRCSGVRPSRSSRCMFLVWPFHAIQARISPPRSAISSPSVSLLLIFTSSTTTYCAY